MVIFQNDKFVIKTFGLFAIIYWFLPTYYLSDFSNNSLGLRQIAKNLTKSSNHQKFFIKILDLSQKKFGVWPNKKVTKSDQMLWPNLTKCVLLWSQICQIFGQSTEKQQKFIHFCHL